MTFLFIETCYNVNHGGDDMPVKIDVHTNIKDHDLTLESCIEIIKVLQESYQSIRQEMYQHFLGMKHLKHAIIAAVISFIGYLLTESLLFIWPKPWFYSFSVYFVLKISSESKSSVISFN